MAAIKDKQSGDPDCFVCDGDGEILVSQDERGQSGFMGHNMEPCPMCMEEVSGNDRAERYN